MPNTCATYVAIVQPDVSAPTFAAPGPYDNIVIGADLTDTNTGPGGIGTLSITAGGTATGARLYAGFEAPSTGTILIDGPGSSYTGGGITVIGLYGNGTLTVSNGGILVGTDGYIGYHDTATGRVTVTGAAAASTWTVRDNLYLGGGFLPSESAPGGNGSLTIADGGQVIVGTNDPTARQSYVGQGAGSTGTVAVTGAAGSRPSYFRTGYLLTVGNYGTGTVEVLNGALMETGSASSSAAYIGRNLGGTGTVLVSGAGSTWRSPGTPLDIMAGYLGTGTLRVENGGVVTARDLLVGTLAGSSGAVNVSNGAVLSTSGSLVVGTFGTGSLAIADGGIVATTLQARIGSETGSSGTATVTGSGSTWTITDGLGVGVGGNGVLTVSNGGRVGSGVTSGLAAGTIGLVPGITGTATVTGAGSAWLNGGPLLVGLFGTGTLTVADGGIVTSQDLAVLGYVSGGSGTATVTGAGSAWVAPGDIQIGLQGAGTLTIADGGTVFADTGTVAIAVEAGSAGTLNIGAPAGAAPVAPGTLLASGITFGAGTGRIVFNHTSTGYSFTLPVSGPGTVQNLAGTTIFTQPGAMTYSGPTLVDGGILRAGAVGAFSPNSAHSVAAGAQLDLAGFDQTVGGLTNAGLVTMGSVPGTVLTVAGNYAGQGGSIAMNTVLAGDTSATDRLVIQGGTGTGDTILRIANAGGTGAQTAEGIRVVQATDGATTAAGAFRLDTRVAAGAYEYLLFQGGSTSANDWFLRSALLPPTAVPDPGAPAPVQATPAAPPIPLYRPEVALYAPVAAIGRQMGLATLGTLHERVGDEENIRDLTGGGYANGSWARAFGERTRNRWDGTVDSAATANLIGLQAGFDILRTQPYAGGHRDHAGVYVAYTDYNAPAVSGFALGVQNLRVGRLLMSGPSVGAYWTHFGPSGWYLDAVFQASWYDVSARSDFGTGLSTNATGYTASLEAGYPIRFGANWQIEPQAQIIHQSISVDRSRDAYSAVDWDAGNAWTGRIGARLQYTGRDAQGTLWQPYAKVNLWHAFSGTDRIDFGSPTRIENRFGDTALEAGAGITARVNTNTSLYAHADYRWSVDGGRSRQTSTQGTVGIRVNW